MMTMPAADWATISSLATAARMLVLVVATFAAVRLSTAQHGSPRQPSRCRDDPSWLRPGWRTPKSRSCSSNGAG